MHDIPFLFPFSVNELLKIKEDLTKERDDLLSEIVKGRDNLSESQNKLSKLEQDQQESHQKIQEVSWGPFKSTEYFNLSKNSYSAKYIYLFIYSFINYSILLK